MSEVTLSVKGLDFIHPKESVRASCFIQHAKNSSDDRLKAVANLFFATLFNLGNTAYYTTSTVLGTVKRFATEGKKEAKVFLNAEGIKALNTVIYTATTALLTIASLYDSNWALSHIEVNCAHLTQEERLKKSVAALARKGDDFQVSFLQIMDLYDLEIRNESNTMLSTINYGKIFNVRYQEDFADPGNLDNILKGMKKVLAAIAFMRDSSDNVPNFQHEYEAAQIELFGMKAAVNIEKTAANRQYQADRDLREDQDQEFQTSIAVDRQKAEEALAKGVQEEALGEIEGELGQVLEGLNARLKSFGGIGADLESNWQQTESKSGGRYAMDAKTIFKFVSARLRAVDLGAIVSNPELADFNKVPERAALEKRRERYPLAEDAFFERIGAAQKTIQDRTVEINTLIDYAGLTLLKNAFPEDAQEEQQVEHGQYILDHIAACRQ